MYSRYYDTRKGGSGRWLIAGSMDGENWYYVYERLFSFPSQDEAQTWMGTGGQTSEEIGLWIARNAIVKSVIDSTSKE